MAGAWNPISCDQKLPAERCHRQDKCEPPGRKNRLLEEVNFGENVEVLIAYSRENAFSQQVELNLGAREVIRKRKKTVEYQGNVHIFIDIIPGKSYSVQGKVSEIGDLREFELEDGLKAWLLISNSKTKQHQADSLG